jgi:transcriptional regulator with XRE-family HTH domain
MPADPALGHRIERRRQVLGMTQEELARRVGVNRASIGNWESGRHFPKRYIGKLEEILGITLAGGPLPQPDSGGGAPLSDEARKALMEEYVRLGRRLGLPSVPQQGNGVRGGHEQDEGRTA